MNYLSNLLKFKTIILSFFAGCSVSGLAILLKNKKSSNDKSPATRNLILNKDGTEILISEREDAVRVVLDMLSKARIDGYITLDYFHKLMGYPKIKGSKNYKWLYNNLVDNLKIIKVDEGYELSLPKINRRENLNLFTGGSSDKTNKK